VCPFFCTEPDFLVFRQRQITPTRSKQLYLLYLQFPASGTTSFLPKCFVLTVHELMFPKIFFGTDLYLHRSDPWNSISSKTSKSNNIKKQQLQQDRYPIDINKSLDLQPLPPPSLSQFFYTSTTSIISISCI
jgi:hypothetical protein